MPGTGEKYRRERGETGYGYLCLDIIRHPQRRGSWVAKGEYRKNLPLGNGWLPSKLGRGDRKEDKSFDRK